MRKRGLSRVYAGQVAVEQLLGAMVGAQGVPKWLCVDALLGQFERNRARARQRYERFAAQGIAAQSVWKDLRARIYLGDERFVQRMQAKLEREVKDVNIPRAQCRPPLARIAAAHENRDQAVVTAHETGEYSYQQIADHFGVHFTTVGRIVRAGKSRRRQRDAK
jgi:putative transposase